MTIDEAIAYCHNIGIMGKTAAARKHRQLEQMLKEYKGIRRFSNWLVERCSELEKKCHEKAGTV